MSTKDKIIKFGTASIILIAISITLILIYCLPKQNDNVLMITSKDITMNVSEEDNLNYNISNPNAVVTFKIEDKTILSSEGFKLTALKEGKTTITLKAKFSNEIAECVCNIEVLPKDSQDGSKDNNNGNVENPDDNNPENPNNNPDETNPIKPDPDNPNNDESKGISFEIINQTGCQVEANKIFVSANKSCYFRLSSSELDLIEDYDLLATENIKLNKTEMGCNTWKIVAGKSGKITINVNGKVIGTIIIEIL